MNKFSYQAINNNSEKIAGVISAPSYQDATRTLNGKGLQLVELKEFNTPKSSNFKHGKLRQENINLALHELATMLNGGVSIAEAVSAQADSSHHPLITQSFFEIAKALRQGHSFSDALSATALKLPPYMIQLIKAGEMTGNIGRSLSDGVSQLAFDLKIKQEMRNTLIYPSILVFSGVAAVLLMFIFVVPKFANLLDNAEQIPLLGYMVLATGVWTNENWILLSVIISGFVLLVLTLLKSDEVRLITLDWLAKLPLIGDWLIEGEIASWSKVLGALLGSKVPLLDALSLASKSVQVPHRKRRLKEVIKEVKAGETLSRSLEQHQIMTATGYNLIRVGERSGELPKMLASLAQLYDEMGKNRMTRVLALIEPVAILVIGTVIGLIIMGIILAITSANDIVV